VEEEVKAIKKRRLFGFLSRNKGKDAKATARKPKKGRAEKAKAPKKGLFGFLRRKKAVKEDGDNTA
jgi:hypothetical protein